MAEKSTALSWGDIERLAKELAQKVRDSGFQPDYLIGIAIGGLVPLTLIAKELDTKNVATISARSYGLTAQGKLEITALPDIDLSDKKVLLVDEVADHGTTLRHVSNLILERYKVKEVRSAVLVLKGHSSYAPNYFVTQTDEWIVFPWEKIEWEKKARSKKV